tara:strand:+ start:59 stop:967 length:909 start_codon:yes stop_codon:yes gene_type:complete
MGPTAIGKTDLAMQLSDKMPVKIISVDSVQIYKFLDIGSGKPNPDTLKAYPHDLVDILEPQENYSTARFQKDCIRSIKDAFESNKLPILVGGTMMYFDHLIHGISNLPSVEKELRIDLENEFSLNGNEKMHKYLNEIDEESAAKIHKNDTQRIKRAIEVFKATGKKFSELQKQHQKVIDKTISSSNLLQFAIRPDDKNLHREKIAIRFRKMIEEGLVQEVENILNLEGMSKESQSMKSVGYRQVCEFLDGEVSLDVMITKAINSTRQLSKRQMTWLKSWQNINFLETKPNLSQIVQDFITRH